MTQDKVKELSVSEEQKKRITDAMKSYVQIKKELAGFTKPRKLSRTSTRGEWCDALCLEFEPLPSKAVIDVP